jgi:hypothetical protein
MPPQVIERVAAAAAVLLAALALYLVLVYRP